MRMNRAAIVSLTLLALIGCSARDASVPDDDTTSVGAADSPAERGRRAARKAIAEGRPVILFAGLPAFDRGWLDEETGLPLSNTGCVITDESAAYEAAFNAEIRRALAAGELGDHVLKHKVTTRQAIWERLAAGAQTITLNGPPVLAPGGLWSILLRPRSEKDATAYLFATNAGGVIHELMFVGGDRATLAFDHDGTTLYAQDPTYHLLMTFDLPSGLFMQGFRDRER